jgi:hypothetical protein
MNNKQHNLTLISHVSKLSVAGMALIKKPHSSACVRAVYAASGSCGPTVGAAHCAAQTTAPVIFFGAVVPSTPRRRAALCPRPRPPPHDHDHAPFQPRHFCRTVHAPHALILHLFPSNSAPTWPRTAGGQDWRCFSDPCSSPLAHLPVPPPSVITWRAAWCSSAPPPPTPTAGALTTATVAVRV